MGLEVVGNANLTYFLDGKVDLRDVSNPTQLIHDESMLYLVNLDVPKPEISEESDKYDLSLEV
jgi:hypothetical protein